MNIENARRHHTEVTARLKYAIRYCTGTSLPTWKTTLPPDKLPLKLRTWAIERTCLSKPGLKHLCIEDIVQQRANAV